MYLRNSGPEREASCVQKSMARAPYFDWLYTGIQPFDWFSFLWVLKCLTFEWMHEKPLEANFEKKVFWTSKIYQECLLGKIRQILNFTGWKFDFAHIFMVDKLGNNKSYWIRFFAKYPFISKKCKLRNSVKIVI